MGLSPRHRGGGRCDAAPGADGAGSAHRRKIGRRPPLRAVRLSPGFGAVTLEHFAHDMPFGAAALLEGGVRFRLWAPARDKMTLVLGDRTDGLPMERLADGWFERTVAE